MIIMALAGVVVAAGVCVTIWYCCRSPRSLPQPDVAAAPPEEVAKYMASEEFGKLSEAERRDYIEKLRDAREPQEQRRLMRSGAELSDEERRQLRANVAPVFQKMMEDRIDRYFALPASQQQAYLDEMIDQMQQFVAQRPAARPTPREASGSSSEPAGGRGRGFTPERLKQRIETTDPAKRAKFVEFFKAFRRRMEERGIRFDRRPPR